MGRNGDFFNSDTIENTTTAGTMDTDVRWTKMFDVGVGDACKGHRDTVRGY